MVNYEDFCTQMLLFNLRMNMMYSQTLSKLSELSFLAFTIKFKFLQDSQWKALASLNVLNTAQNLVITAGLVAGTVYCAHLVMLGQFKVCLRDVLWVG